MKKYLLLIVALIGMFLVPSVKAEIDLPEVTDHEKVKVYLFRGEGCSHCYDFLSYFADVYQDYEDYFEIVVYESWKDSYNQALMLAVKEEVGEEADGGVPFIVVGDSYHLVGFGDNSGEEIIEKALEEYQNDDYTDLVQKVIETKDIEASDLGEETLVEAATSEGVVIKNNKSNDGISDGVVIGIVFGVLIVGFAGLVVLSRKE